MRRTAKMSSERPKVKEAKEVKEVKEKSYLVRKYIRVKYKLLHHRNHGHNTPGNRGLVMQHRLTQPSMSQPESTSWDTSSRTIYRT